MRGPHAILAALTFEPGGFGWLEWLAVSVGVTAVVLAYNLSLRWRQHAPAGRAAMLGCRLGAVLCLFVALLHPTCVRQTASQHRPVLAVLLDDSGSMGLPAAADAQADAGPTRYARAVEILRKKVLPALGDDVWLQVYDVEARPVALGHLPASPAREHSPLTHSLLRVQHELCGPDRQSHEEMGVAGILLLSDGAEVADELVAGGLEQLRVPVHAIEVAAASARLAGPPDLAIEAVAVNRQARLGNTVQAVIDLSASGQVPAASMPTSILDGTRVLASRTVEWASGDLTRRVELEFVPNRPGDLTLTVQVGAAPGEVNLDNNRQTFGLSVRARALTVLFIDGVLRWEGKFIRQALADDPDINVISWVRTAPAGADRGSQGLLLGDSLANVHLVILGDVEASYFSAEEIKALRAWVTDRRGALLLTGGYHGFGSEGFGRSELREIMPVEFSAAANPQIEQPFSLKLTEAGMEHPIFHLSGDRLRDAAFFQSLPALAGCCRIAGIKPGAQVLAVNPTIRAPDGSQGLPVMVAQQVGTGRTMVLAVDTTWRWRTVVAGFTGDASFYARFWGQTARWLTGMETEPPQHLVVSTDRRAYKLGQTIELNVALRAGPSKPARAQPAGAGPASGGPSGWQVSALAIDEQGNRLSVPLAELGDGRYRGTLGASRAGRWDIVVAADPPPPAVATQPGQEPQAQSQVVTIQVQRPDRETLDPRPDGQWLAAVAQRTGGRYLQADEIEAWARDLPRQPVHLALVERTDLWRHPVLAVLFLSLLCAEWILRRRSRLV